jgi:hypothetical protein
MERSLKPRVQAFLRHVEETEAADVAREFTALFSADENPNEANLFLLLEKAKHVGTEPSNCQPTRNGVLIVRHCHP